MTGRLLAAASFAQSSNSGVAFSTRPSRDATLIRTVPTGVFVGYSNVSPALNPLIKFVENGKTSTQIQFLVYRTDTNILLISNPVAGYVLVYP